MMTILRFAVPILACFSVGCFFAESGQSAENVWETLPVFHNGRIMPLHTFARQTVREICGTPNPYISRPAAGVPMPKETAERIRQIIPAEGRIFQADEILLSWFSESQSKAWQFIPIFPVDDSDYAEDIFGAAAGKENRTPPQRVSLYQLAASRRYQMRLAEAVQRKHSGQFLQKPVRFDQITEKLEQQAGLFKGLTFFTPHGRLDRMLALLERCAGTESPSSYRLVQESWAILCSYGEAENGGMPHPTAARWNDIAGKLRFILDAWRREEEKPLSFIEESADETGRIGTLPLQKETEDMFEQIIALTEESLDESAACMESLYPGTKYRTTGPQKDFDVKQWLPKLYAPENFPQNQAAIRRSAITYYYAVKKLRNDIEAAYLALYDNGYALRLAPLPSPYVLAMGLSPEKYDVSPWATIQMIAGSGDAFTKRFIDTDSGAASLMRDWVQRLFNNSVQKIPYGSREFHADAVQAVGFLRSNAIKAEFERLRQVAANGESENPQIQELMAKSAYPGPPAGGEVSLAAEYWYDRLNLFWFMSFFACAAVIFAAGSYCAVAFRSYRIEEMLFWISIAMLTFSAAAAVIGAVMRAVITGWAPVTNMYETVVLTALSAAVFGVWYAAYPLIQPVFSSAWEYSKIQRPDTGWTKDIGRLSVLFLRILLTAATFYLIVLFAGGGTTGHGFTAAAAELFAATDGIDRIVVAASVLLMLRFIPPVLLTPVLALVFLLFRSSRNAAGLYIRSARQEMLQRKLFIIITAGIVFLIGLITAWNRTELNPDFRPIAAVLRSNFWLTVHVFAIVVSYAAAFVAWGMAAVTLGYLIFGKYPHAEISGAASGGGKSAVKRIVQMPDICRFFTPMIDRLLKFALLLLMIGTVLGARWADYSWGRFWSWDPKEVWALITIIFYVIVFHGKIARYYRSVGIITGALFASIAVIITWYGINFVFKGSVHSYGSGNAANATLFLTSFIMINLLWGGLALLRYGAEMYGSERADSH
ncbi:MAG: cytochrome c biogenesis protein CcsA [Planctomycetaceae bacterium]|jgi:ABC-type transport system involved in cytochrome c biogenesis permease subunit|nr:cytochrome c biogenesis protein CcsA [Planctomycetaceae bacterium]